LEALVFLKILTVIVTKMIVGNATGKANTTTDQEVAHDGLEAGLSTLEVRAGDEGVVLAGILNDSGVERVLRGSVQI